MTLNDSISHIPLAILKLFLPVKLSCSEKKLPRMRNQSQDLENVEDVSQEDTQERESALHSSTISQFVTSIIVCMASFSCGCTLAWTSPALPDLERKRYFGDLSLVQKSWIASAVTLGAAFSGPAAGFIVDYYGRKRSFLIMCIPNIMGWVLIAFSPTVIVMSFGRLLTGVAVGGFILSTSIYLAEITEQRIRGMLMSTTVIALGSGMLATYIIGTFFSWFVSTIANLVFSIVLLLCIRTVPESPVYLIHQGHKKKAGEELMRLRGATEFHQIEKELNELQSNSLDNVETSQPEKSAHESSSLWRKLTRRGTLKAIAICFALMIFQQLCGVNAVIFFASTIFAAAKTNLDANVCAIIIGFDILFAVFLTSFLIDRLGRRMLLFISLLGNTICLASLGAFFYLQRINDGITPDGISWIPLASLMLFMIFYNIGIGPLAWFLMSELIPTDVKGLASAAASSFNWLLAFFVTKTFENFVNLVGIEVCFWFFAGNCLVGLAFSFLFVPETKGKTLDKIHRLYFSDNSDSNLVN